MSLALLLGCARAAPTSSPASLAGGVLEAARSSAETTIPPEPALGADVLEYVNGDVAGGVYPGLVLGLIDEAGPSIKGFGVRSLSDDPSGSHRPDARTVYEIGSLTKVFTGTLLAQMSLSGEVRLGAPVSEYLPREVRVSQFEDQPITLLSLSTHTSGLPPMPSNFAPATWDNPFADYTVARLYEFVQHVALARRPGEGVQYSNVGFGLLGHALALRAGMPFDELVQRRISRVIGLSDTTGQPSPSMLARLARGTHDAREVGSWDVPTLAGAGGLRSTAADLLTFLAAHMELLETPLAPAMALSQARHLRGTELGGLGWGIREEGNVDVFLHSGGTGGYSSFFGFKRPRTPMPGTAAASAPVRGTLGVVLLANAADVHLAELGLRLLDIGPRLLPTAHVLTESAPRGAAEQDVLHDGAFSDDLGAWVTDALSPRIDSGALCVQVLDASTRFVGWPGSGRSGLSLQAGQAYSLVFRAWTFGNLEVRVEAKVGHRVEPYTPAIVARVPAGAEPRTFRVSFVAPRDDSDSGIAFSLYPGTDSSPPGTFCLDDVTLSPDEHRVEQPAGSLTRATHDGSGM